MKIIVGLGNPGQQYERTRHNMGFVVVDELCKKMRQLEQKAGGNMMEFVNRSKFMAEIAQGEGVLLVKPQMFMNRSGESVAKLMNFYKTKMDGLCLIHDDLDIELGMTKVQRGRGPKVHNGLNSVEQAVGDKDFWRVRVGVENRTAEEKEKIPGEKYVLGTFSSEEEQLIAGVINEVVDKLMRGWDGFV